MGKKMDARQYIKIRGANENNLKNIDVDIPRNELVVLTGLSGSGKSSLAFDTIYAEGQRRYMESLSSYARQFLGQMEKPDVESIEGLSPAISIDQKSTNHNPRSTVGTVTEIYDYFRLLYARVGIPHCPKCGREIAKHPGEGNRRSDHRPGLCVRTAHPGYYRRGSVQILSALLPDARGALHHPGGRKQRRGPEGRSGGRYASVPGRHPDHRPGRSESRHLRLRGRPASGGHSLSPGPAVPADADPSGGYSQLRLA